MSKRSFTDAELRAALEEANIPTLLCVMTHLSGDDRWLKDPYTPAHARGLDDNDSGGLSEELRQEVREAAVAIITAVCDGDREPAELSFDQIASMLATALAEDVAPEYGELLGEELGVVSRDVELPPAPPAEDFSVLIIGSGMSGLSAAIKLGQAGVAYTLVEKNDDIGGTWFENIYPGCGVDTPSHLYSFSWAMNTQWPRYFALQRWVHEYFAGLADEHGVRDNVQFGTEVVSARWDAEEAIWRVQVRRSDGTEEELTANAVITAVGITSRAWIPPIEGLDTFPGPMMHTQQWDPSTDVEGKHVAVIGTGASSMQLVPAIAGKASKVTVFQRSPQWALPHPNYKRDVSEGARWCLEHVPTYAGWYRLRVFWNFGDRLYDSLMIDPNWEHPDRSINETNEKHRLFLTDYIRKQLGDKADELMDKCLPTYPPYGKRPLIDNAWFKTMTRDDVDLVTEAVASVDGNTITTVAGTEVGDIDILVIATGFRTLQFLWPMEITGRSGTTLRETWGEEDARGYLGITVPDFPNFFMINGPNTSAGHGGSAVIATEFETRYVMGLLGKLIEGDTASVEVRDDVFWNYQERVDEALSHTIWTHPGMTTYYRNSKGRLVTTSPWKYIDFWRMTKEPDFSEYLLEPAAERSAA